ncbi:MAG: hypothetical protein ACE15C_16790 [Phycisphaerae bacterium]
MFQELVDLYSRNCVVDTADQRLEALPLHKTCPRCKDCWGAQEVVQSACFDKWNRISLPYVGPGFAATPKRLLIAGQNLNGDGGLLEVQGLAVHALCLLSRGVKKIRFGNPASVYRGSLFWHRMATYSAIVLRSDWEITGNSVTIGGNNIADNAAILAEAMESIAFLNMIKCSPPDERSKPFQEMWNWCPRTFAYKEIEILDPGTLIVLGKDAIYPLKNSTKIQTTEVDTTGAGKVSLHLVHFSQRRIPAFNIVHPTAPGGSDGKLISYLAEMVEKNKGVLTA